MPILRHHRRHHRIHPKHSDLPYGVRVLAWARAIRWIGWGFGEALLPVFILFFSKTFAEMGLLSSTVDIAALLSLPLISVWADKMPARRLILLSLILYPLVGLSYLLAGVLGMALFIVIARVVNGFTWELENVGIETYYRRVTDSKKIATSFGYIDTLSHIAWISASLAGILLVRFMPIHYLLFGIAPFALIAYVIVLRAPKDSVRPSDNGPRSSFLHSYAKTLSEWRTWNTHLWLLGALVLFSGIVSSLMYFFIPIDAYLEGANLPMVVLITVFGAIPALFGYKLGRIADASNKYILIAKGLIGVGLISLGLFIFPYYWYKLLAIFFMGIILELFYVVQSSLVTTLGPAETYGERGGAFESVVTLGDLVAPLILGIGLDGIGFANLSLVIAAGALALSVLYHLLKEKKVKKFV